MLILVGLLFLLTIGLAVYALLPSTKDKKMVSLADVPKETSIIRPWPEPAVCPPAQNVEAVPPQENNLEIELKQIKQENADLKEDQARKAEGLSKENSDLANKIKLLETQIETYKKEMAQLNEAAAQKPQTTPQPAGETVSKEEYEELKKKLEAAESVLKIVHGEMDSQ